MWVQHRTVPRAPSRLESRKRHEKNDRFIRQPVGIDVGRMVAMDGLAIDEQPTATVRADLSLARRQPASFRK